MHRSSARKTGVGGVAREEGAEGVEGVGGVAGEEGAEGVEGVAEGERAEGVEGDFNIVQEG